LRSRIASAELFRMLPDRRMSVLGPGRVETSFAPQNCAKPGALDLHATV